jgi:8-oxo-dGTP pyrophosphatase MutT (NUDIX family)
MNPSTLTPPIPVRASTVILVRNQKGPLEVYLLRRSSRSDFMPGNYVFPGGTVEFDDMDPDFWKKHVDMDPGQVRSCLRQRGSNLGLEEAMAHGIAAIRETFEEAGILFANRSPATGKHMAALRQEQSCSALPANWLRQLIQSGGWTLTLSALSPWSHWITPVARSRRYDTRFFMAVMPEGQECQPDHRETADGVWSTPDAALAGNLEGTLPLSPPTLVTVQELLPYPNVASLKRELATRSWGETRVPRLIPLPGGALILLPWDTDYANEAFRPDIKSLNVREGPSQRPISRIWYTNGLWLPVTP